MWWKNFIPKSFLNFFILVCCLQNHVSFVETREMEEAASFSLEFRRVYKGESRWVSPPLGPEGPLYEHKIKDHRISAHRKQDAFWVANSNIIKASEKDITSAVIRQLPRGQWAIQIVFNRDFSQNLIHSSKPYVGHELAILMNGELITVPLLGQPLSLYLNTQGQYPLIIPTAFTTQGEAEAFLKKFPIALSSHLPS